jgi:hypothetical protein
MKMKDHLRRLSAMLLCLMLLPIAAFAETASVGYGFDVSFSMDASTYPESDQTLMQGIADTLNMLTLSGTFAMEGNSFDLTSELLLENDEDTRTSLHIYGTDTHYQIGSSLLGDQELLLNNLALLEFAIKAYNHLGMPLQYPALLVSTYAHTSAFDWIRDNWNDVMNAEEGDRVIARDDVIELASYAAENAEQDRAFYYWLAALALESGYSDMVLETITELPDWLDGILDDEGITVTCEEDTETWSSGEETFFTRTANEESESFSLTLPMLPDGNTVEANYQRTYEDGNIELTILIANEEDETTMLDASVTLTGWTDTLPMNGDADLQVALSGEMVPNAVNAHFTYHAEDGQMALSQLDAETDAAMLTLQGTLTEQELSAPAYSAENLNGVNVFSLNDSSMKTLVTDIVEPFVKGVVPLLKHLPLSAYESVFSLLEQYGILDMLTANLE